MNYDFEHFNRVFWAGGPSIGAIKLVHHHHICAMIEAMCTYTAANYTARLEVRQNRPRTWDGVQPPPLPKLTKQELMMLDMDHILSAVFDPNGPAVGWVVQLYTNDREDPEWLEFVRSCPHAYLVAEIPSKMGPYNIQQWIFARKDPRR